VKALTKTSMPVTATTWHALFEWIIFGVYPGRAWLRPGVLLGPVFPSLWACCLYRTNFEQPTREPFGGAFWWIHRFGHGYSSMR
jgi:hypothetical protein